MNQIKSNKITIIKNKNENGESFFQIKHQSVTNEPKDQSRKRKVEESSPHLKKNSSKSINNRKINTKQTSKLKKQEPLEQRKELNAVGTLMQWGTQRNQEIALHHQETLSIANHFFNEKDYEAAFAEYITLYLRLTKFDKVNNSHHLFRLQFQALKRAVLSYYTKNSQPIPSEYDLFIQVSLFLKMENNLNSMTMDINTYTQKVYPIHQMIYETENFLSDGYINHLKQSNLIKESTISLTPQQKDNQILSPLSHHETSKPFLSLSPELQDNNNHRRDLNNN